MNAQHRSLIPARPDFAPHGVPPHQGSLLRRAKHGASRGTRDIRPLRCSGHARGRRRLVALSVLRGVRNARLPKRSSPLLPLGMVRCGRTPRRAHTEQHAAITSVPRRARSDLDYSTERHSSVVHEGPAFAPTMPPATERFTHPRARTHDRRDLTPQLRWAEVLRRSRPPMRRCARYRDELIDSRVRRVSRAASTSLSPRSGGSVHASS